VLGNAAFFTGYFILFQPGFFLGVWPLLTSARAGSILSPGKKSPFFLVLSFFFVFLSRLCPSVYLYHFFPIFFFAGSRALFVPRLFQTPHNVCAPSHPAERQEYCAPPVIQTHHALYWGGERTLFFSAFISIVQTPLLVPCLFLR